MRMMGPFDRSTEREFALTVNRRAIDDCSNLEQLKPVAKNLLEGWSSMQTAFQSLMLENIQLRQARAIINSFTVNCQRKFTLSAVLKRTHLAHVLSTIVIKLHWYAIFSHG